MEWLWLQSPSNQSLFPAFQGNNRVYDEILTWTNRARGKIGPIYRWLAMNSRLREQGNILS